MRRRRYRRSREISADLTGIPEIMQDWMLGYILNYLERCKPTDEALQLLVVLTGHDAVREFVLEYMPPDNEDSKEKFESIKKRKKMDHGSLEEGLFDYFSSFIMEKTSHDHFRMKSLLQRLRHVRKGYIHTKRALIMPQVKRLLQLKNILSLSENGLEVFKFLICFYGNDDFENLISGDNLRSDSLFNCTNGIHLCTGISKYNIKKSFESSQGGFLASFSQARQDGFDGAETYFIDYIAGFISYDKLLDEYIHEKSEPELPLRQFKIDPFIKKQIGHLLNLPGRINILLHGKPGSGKTEFARSLGAHLKKQVYFVKHEGKYRESNNIHDRLCKIIFCCHLARKPGDIVVVDEADHLLNHFAFFLGNSSMKYGDKGVINSFLDHKQNSKVIWIVNDIQNIPDSTKRRFDFSLQFDELDKKQMQDLQKKLLAEHHLMEHVSVDFLENFLHRYTGNIAVLKRSLELTNRIMKRKKKDTLQTEKLIKNFLQGQAELTGNLRKAPPPINERYDIRFVNTDIPIRNLMKYLGSFFKAKEARSDQTSTKEAIGVNLLFSGLPGTGKTELAKYIAHAFQQSLILKRASDLLSCFVGETEKNIAAAFGEAEKKNAILFIDEADSFFTSRESAFRSWEVTQTNELLTQMEAHSILLICCTNLIDNLDSASIRRFSWKIKFSPLKDAHKIKVFQSFFGEKENEPSEILKYELSRIKHLTLGDFKAVWNRYKFIDKDSYQDREIIDALQNEVEYKQMREAVGFD